MKPNSALCALSASLRLLAVFKPRAACTLAIGFLFVASHCEAAKAVGSASATVVDFASIVVNLPALTGTVFTAQSFTDSLSTSGPLLRVGVTPPAPESGPGAGSAPPGTSTAAVTVTRSADGSLAVSGGTGLTFAVSQSADGPINIEYN